MYHDYYCCVFDKHGFCSCIDHELTDAELNDLVEQWHDNDHGLQLHVWLGMSWNEYRTWVEGTYTRELKPFNRTRPFPVKASA